jgi:DNA-binding IclR family transcriptional regulator
VIALAVDARQRAERIGVAAAGRAGRHTAARYTSAAGQRRTGTALRSGGIPAGVSSTSAPARNRSDSPASARSVHGDMAAADS